MRLIAQLLYIVFVAPAACFVLLARINMLISMIKNEKKSGVRHFFDI
jgi:hypothetical protein